MSGKENTLQQQITLIENNPLIKQLIDTVPDVVIVLNPDRHIVFANTTLTEIWGVCKEDMEKGIFPGDAFQCVHAIRDGACGTTKFCDTCGANQAIRSSMRGVAASEECRITRIDDSALDFRVWSKPIELNGAIYSIFVAQDISHAKRRRALERIFFHDVMNTAGAVYGYTALLSERDANENLDILIDRAHGLSKRLIEEIASQSELTRAENNELTPKPMPTNALYLLQIAYSDYLGHPVAERRRMIIDPASEDVAFVSDPTLLRRVLGNMVKNALEACLEGQTVTLRCGPVEGGVEFVVHNPNVMPEDVQMQVFQRSFSTKGLGRGLGTYSIKLLTERYLKGQVTFTSASGQGTRFMARYPLTLPVMGT